MNAVTIVKPLQETEIEQQLLGCILTDETVCDQMVSALEPADFYDPLHQRVFGAVVAMREAGQRTTPLTVRARLGDDPGLKEVGPDYLRSLAQASNIMHPLAEFARIIRDTAIRREAIRAAQYACEALRDHTITVAEALADVMFTADRAAQRDAAKRGQSSAGAASVSAIHDVEAMKGGKVKPCISTGIESLDKMLGGLYGGDLIIVAGRPGMGKSTLATALARTTGEQLRQCDYYSLEMTAKQLSVRLVTDIDFDNRGQQIPLSYSRIFKGRAGDSEMDRAARASIRLAELPIEIHDRDSMTMTEIAAIARARAANVPMGLIVIDHLQIISVSDRYRGNRVQEITEITKQCKALAKRIGWPVVLLCQLSRESEKRPDRRPQLSDLRESGSIEQDADVVIGMYRAGYYVEHNRPADKNDPKYSTWKEEYRDVANDLELIVLKQRMGETGAVPVYCDMGASVIRDKNHAQPISAGHENPGAGLLV